MPVQLADLRDRLHRTIALDLGNDSVLTFSWAPEKVNDDYYKQLAAYRATVREQEAARELAKGMPGAEDPPPREYVRELAAHRVVPFVVGWELEDGGKPYPITVENVAALGHFVVEKMADAIDEDALQYRDLGKGSKGG